MRKFILSMLLAGVAASPAIAQPNDDADRQAQREERAQAREERQQARQQVREERSNNSVERQANVRPERPSGPAVQLEGLRPAQTPKIAATLSGSWEKDGKGAELVLRRVGAQYEDDLNTRSLKGATTLDAFGSWPLGRDLQIVARAENLTNALVMSGISGDGAVERATPRTFWIGLRLR